MLHHRGSHPLRLLAFGAALATAPIAACGDEPSGPSSHDDTGAGAGASTTSTTSTSTSGAGGGGGAGQGGGGAASSQGGAASCDDKAKSCASEFGALFTKSNGRADGALVALVRPADTQCALPNSTHVVLQLEMQGQVQRLVASIDGVAVATKAAPLVGPAYAEGWHEDVPLEYATDLGVHSTDFAPVSMAEAIDFVCSHLELGAPVSVYAYSDGSKPDSAHQIHSNDGYPDGAIVVDPTGATPTYLLFRYVDQTF